MRILQLSFNSAKTFKQRLYGVSMYTLGTNRILKEIGDVDLYVVAPTLFYVKGRPQESYLRPKFGTEKLSDGVYIRYTSPLRFLKYVLGFIRHREFYMPLYSTYPTLESMDINDGYDAIFFEFFSFINAVKKTKALKVYRSHEIYAEYRSSKVREMEREAFEQADIIMPPSSMDKSIIVDMYGIDEDKVHPIPIPIEIRKIPKKDYVDKEKLIAIFSGFPHKYNIEAIEFLKLVAESTPYVEYHIFGAFNPKMFGWMPPNMIFHGFVPRKDYEKMLLVADVAVMPIKQRHGINVRVAEYLQYGLPIIATPEAVRGYDFRPNVHYIAFGEDVEFEEALQKALDGKFRERIIKNAVEHARENLNPQKLAERVKKIIG